MAPPLPSGEGGAATGGYRRKSTLLMPHVRKSQGPWDPKVNAKDKTQILHEGDFEEFVALQGLPSRPPMPTTLPPPPPSAAAKRSSSDPPSSSTAEEIARTRLARPKAMTAVDGGNLPAWKRWPAQLLRWSESLPEELRGPSVVAGSLVLLSLTLLVLSTAFSALIAWCVF